MFGLAVTMVGDAAVAEEISQEAFTRAWRHARAYDARKGRVATWLLSITRNLAIDHLRAKRTEPLDPDAIGEADRAMWASSAGSGVDRTWRRASCATSSRQLPADQRRALLLAALFGYTAREIGEIEQIPAGDREDQDPHRDAEARPQSENATRRGGRQRGGRVMNETDCARLHEMAPEVALGIADGEDRAWALEHLNDCSDCRARVERDRDGRRRAAAARAPGRAPGRVRGARRRRDRAPAPARWPRLRVAIPAFAAAALAAVRGLVRALRRPPPRRLLPRHPRRRPRRALRRGPDGDGGRQGLGYVYGYQGRASWVFAVMYDCPYDGRYELQGVTPTAPPSRSRRSRSRTDMAASARSPPSTTTR